MKQLWIRTLVLALIGLMIGIAVVYLARPKPAFQKRIVIETVYVDINRLEKLHPKAKILDDLNRLTAKVASQKSLQFAEKNAISDKQEMLPGNVSADVEDKARDAMTTQVLGNADKALSLWEQDRKKALNIRLAWNRKNMMSRAQDAIWFNKNDIFTKAGDQQRDVEIKYGLNLLNYRTAIKELENGSDIHGYKPVEIPPKLDKLKKELDSVGKQYLAEKHSVDTWMQDEIDRVSNETLADVNSTLSKERVRTTVAIQTDITKARSRISSRLESVNSARQKRPLVIPDVASDTIVMVRPALVRKNIGGIDTRGLIKSSAGIRRKIREEVISAVSDEAQNMGVRVVFDRYNQTNVRDLTDVFARYIRNNVW